ncbi:MAG: winged helix-turn-helix domain-containing protein, partial [Thermoplasmatota archaeon]
MPPTSVSALIVWMAIVVVLIPSADADYEIATPVIQLADVGVIDGRNETCSPQIPVCVVTVNGHPLSDPSNSSVVAQNDFETFFIVTHAPGTEPLNETIALDEIAVPNPVFSAFNATYGPSPHHALDPYAQAWSNHTGVYVSALLPDPNSPTEFEWQNFRQLEWGSGPDRQQWIGDNRSEVDLRFLEADTHRDVGGSVDETCADRQVELEGMACRESGAQTAARMFNGSTPNVVLGEKLNNTSLRNAPPGSQLAGGAFDSSRDSWMTSGLDLAGVSDARLSRSPMGLPDGALPLARGALGPRWAPSDSTATPASTATVASATAPPAVGGRVVLVAVVVAFGAAALVFFVLGLFSRLSREDVLAQVNRARILAALKQYPRGVRASVLGRGLGLDRRTTLYHLDILVKRGLVALVERSGVSLVALPENVAAAREARLGPEFEHPVCVAILRE